MFETPSYQKGLSVGATLVVALLRFAARSIWQALPFWVSVSFSFPTRVGRPQGLGDHKGWATTRVAPTVYKMGGDYSRSGDSTLASCQQLITNTFKTTFAFIITCF